MSPCSRAASAVISDMMHDASFTLDCFWKSKRNRSKKACSLSERATQRVEWSSRWAQPPRSFRSFPQQHRVAGCTQIHANLTHRDTGAGERESAPFTRPLARLPRFAWDCLGSSSLCRTPLDRPARGSQREGVASIRLLAPSRCSAHRQNEDESLVGRSVKNESTHRDADLVGRSELHIPLPAFIDSICFITTTSILHKPSFPSTPPTKPRIHIHNG